ncbi:unnamed protein product [Rhizophagus irregularis]|nr:unnamed protein product [Rhizophagus irregularis]
MDEVEVEDGDSDEEVETQPEIQSSSNSKGKKWANEVTDSLSSKKSKKQAKGGDSIMLKRLIRKLSSDTMRISEIKEKKGLHRESVREVEEAQTFFDLYLKISNAEERNENTRHEKKVNDEVRDQLPKEATKNAIRKKTERARKVYDLFFRISNDKIQQMATLQRIKTFTANSISSLSSDNIKYVASQVKKNTRQI